MSQFTSIIQLLSDLAKFAGERLHAGDYITLSDLKLQLQLLIERYKEKEQ